MLLGKSSTMSIEKNYTYDSFTNYDRFKNSVVTLVDLKQHQVEGRLKITELDLYDKNVLSLI